MEKIFITVILFASSVIYSESHDSSLDNVPQTTGCLCNLGNKPTVPEIFHKNESLHFDRLVIYLYKNPHNNKVFIHIPTDVKQKYLPDINYEDIDILKTVTDEKVIDIFVNYPKYVISSPKHVRHDEDHMLKVSTETLGYEEVETVNKEIGIVDTNEPKHIEHNPHHHYNIDETISDEPNNPDSPVEASIVKDIPDEMTSQDNINFLDYVSPESFDDQPSKKEFDDKSYFITSEPKDAPNNNVKIPLHDNYNNPDLLVKPSVEKDVPDVMLSQDKMNFPDYVTPESFEHHESDKYPIDKPSSYSNDKPYVISYNQKYSPNNNVKTPLYKYDNSHTKNEKTFHLPHKIDVPDYSVTDSSYKKFGPVNIKPQDKVNFPYYVLPVLNKGIHFNKYPSMPKSPVNFTPHSKKDITNNHHMGKNPINFMMIKPNNNKLKLINVIPASYENNDSVMLNLSPPKTTYSVTPIVSKFPSHKHAEKHRYIKYPAIKPTLPRYSWQNPINYFDFTLKNSHKKQPRNNTEMDIVLKYPEYDISPDRKIIQTFVFNNIPKGDKQNKITVKVPSYLAVPPNKFNVLPTIALPNIEKPRHVNFIHQPKQSSSEKRYQFDIDTSDIPDIIYPDIPANLPQYGRGSQHQIPFNFKIQRTPEDKSLPYCNYCKNIKKGTETYLDYITFDEWFREEMYGFRNNKHMIDVNKIGKYILKILDKNGLHISNTGMLIDSNGKVLRLQNLKLRVMLVGDSVTLDKIWRTSVKSKLNPDYLAFAILMSINPPSTLGIIPLGRTVLSFPDSKTVHNRLLKSPFYDVPKMPAEKVFTKRQLDEYEISVEKFLKGVLNSLPLRKQKDVYTSRIAEKNKIKSDMVHEHKYDLVNWKDHHKQKHNHDYIINEDIYGNDDMLRIIGGSAATGSGTPVSSRG